MKIIKVKNGLLEAENFFLASSFSDFAGKSNVSRDISTGKLKLVSDNKIERKFNYDEFVIEIQKENFKNIKENNYSMIYLGNEDYMIGIKDDKLSAQNKYWKILRKNGYIQAYVSNDGINYKNIGGMNFQDDITKQGFMKYNNEDFVLDSYKVYDNPYVTIKNFPKDTICELYDKQDKFIKSRIFDKNLQCRIFIESNMEGYFIFKDKNDNIIHNTSTIQLQYGDVWVYSPYNFEIIYQGRKVTNSTPPLLKDLDEIISIKNIGNKEYKNITIGTESSTKDLIQLSFDGESYKDYIKVENIKQGESKDIYVKITKKENHNFSVRNFQLIINE